MPECGMLEVDRLAIRTKSVVLCKQMVADELLIQSLVADNILTEDMAESILAEKTSIKRNRQLISYLPKRGPRAFSSFCSVLRDTEQHHLCDLIENYRTENSQLEPERDARLSITRAEKRESDSDRDEAAQTTSSASQPIQASDGSPLLESRQADRFGESPLPHPTQEVIAPKRQRTHESMETSLDTDCPITTPVLPCTRDFYLTHCKQGGEVDEEVLRKVFTELDFVVTMQRNLTAQLDWVFESFDNSRCPLLQNKPKMFFIQACRGEEMDCGAIALGKPLIKLPQRSDMICGFASLKGTAAMRNTKRGSWFIQELNAALRLRSRDTHMADILVQVNARIKEREGFAPGTQHHRCKEMSEYTSSLCNDLFLFPKYQHQL
ncbi:hypothetical protein NHX12_001532 [Muraenolepis orangiensis]|uniref:Caspase-2 n=1 Tax=Muraenolepis orangiensis TaxID=630683 RepID=A0A9Q0IHC7_9TELE|nr:hypothetical protein NHX12_001532 [Muraenolepis orangiensis]